MRRPLVIGNWKMHGTVQEATTLARDVAALAPLSGPEVVVAPAFTALAAVAAALKGTPVAAAAQDMHWAERGAFTGEVSPLMVRELVEQVIVGHSERRTLFGETDAAVGRKVHAAFDHELVPVVCVGETLAERDAALTDEVLRRQLGEALAGLHPREVARGVVAYEPVWAIGTGRACGADEAQRVAALIREWVAAAFTPPAGAALRILYGGSMTPDNAAALLGQPDVDGGLVGGASLDAARFAAIVAHAGRVA